MTGGSLVNDKTAANVHWSFWLIGTLTLIWNVLGGVNYIMQMDADIVASLPETHRAIIVGRPAWATGGFAFTVFGGALGCLLLLFRNKAALYVFVVSLLGVIVTSAHTIRVARSTIEFSLAEIFVMILSPIIVAAFLLWYAKQAQKKTWIR
jgi:hypothetical protein